MVLVKKKSKKEEELDIESLVDEGHEGVKNEKKDNGGIAS